MDCARYTRNGIHRESRHAASGEGGEQVGLESRGEQADEGLAVVQARDLGIRRGIDLHDDVAGPRGIPVADLGAGRTIGVVGEGGARARARLDDDVEAERDDLLDGRRGGGDAILPGLFGDDTDA